MMCRVKVVFSLPLLSLFMFAGCAASGPYAYGGGTIGTGLGYGTGRAVDGAVSAVSYFDLDGVLRDSSGRPLAGVQVEVSSLRSQDRAITDSLGRFRVSAVVAEGEDLSFSFSRQGVRGNYVFRGSTVGVTSGTISFVSDGAGVVLDSIDLR